MLTLTAQVTATLIALSLVVLLVRHAARGAGPVASIATALVLLGWAFGTWFALDLDNPLLSAGNAILNCATAVLLAVYPDGRMFPRWMVVPVSAQLALQVGNALSGWRWDTVWPWWQLALAAILLSLLIGGQLQRFLRRANLTERRQVGWPLLTLLLQMVSFTLLSSLAWAITGNIDGDGWVALSILLNGLVGTGFATGLLWPDLFRIDRALRTTITFGLSSLTLLAVFAGLLALSAKLGLTSVAAAWLGALVVAIISVPLARATGRFADQIVWRGRPDPLAVLDGLGRALEAGIDPLEVPAVVVRSIGETLHVRGARLMGAGIDASWGQLGPDVEEFDVVHAGETIARLGVTPRAAESRLNEHDHLVVGQLSHQAAGALDRARTMIALTEARTRLVHAREEERRRVRRDLHDDLAPSFAGLGMSAAVLGELVREHDPRATDAARRLADELASASRRVREIAYDLRPPVLDEHGLLAAIDDRIGSTGAPPSVLIVAPDHMDGLPAAVESAALRIVQEAVANVRRHSAASECRVELRRIGESLHIDVTDDGRGFPDVRVDGIGLRSMRERAAELGGVVLFDRSDAGGALVRAILPLHAVAS